MAVLGGLLVFVSILVFVAAIQATKRRAHLDSERRSLAKAPLTPIGSIGPDGPLVIVQGEVVDGGTIEDPWHAGPVSYFDLRVYERHARRRSRGEHSSTVEYYFKTVFEFRCGHPVLLRDSTGTAIVDMEGASYFLSEMSPETYLLKRHFDEALGTAEALSEEIRFILEAIRHSTTRWHGKKRIFLARRFCIKPGDSLVVAGRPTLKTEDGSRAVHLGPRAKEDCYVTDLGRGPLTERLASRKEALTLSALILYPLALTLLLAGIGCVVFGFL